MVCAAGNRALLGANDSLFVARSSSTPNIVGLHRPHGGVTPTYPGVTGDHPLEGLLWRCRFNTICERRSV
jgi:hypothetical protein